MDSQRVADWIERVSGSLAAASREEAEAYQRLDGSERWLLVVKACHGARRWVDPLQQERLEATAERDHERFGVLMRDIRARLGE